MEDWEYRRLGEVGALKNGLNKDKKDFGFGHPFINLLDVFGRSIYEPTDLGLVNASPKELRNFDVRAGDVIFIRSSVKREGVAEAILIPENLPRTVYSGFLIRFRESSNVLAPPFKRYVFGTRGFRKEVLSYATTSANTNINQDSLEKVAVIFPSHSEQRKIAGFLTEVDGRIGQLIQKKTLLEDYKKGVMQQLFTQAIRFKDDHGNDFPDWENKGIGDSIEMLSGFPFPSQEILDGESTNGRFRVLLMRGVNITEGSIRHSVDRDRFFCGEVTKLQKYELEVGDLVIGMDGSKVGKNSAIVGEAECGALLVQRVARIRPVAGVSLQYIYQHINSFVFHRYVDRVKTSSGIPHISAKQIREFEIGFPCLEEQTKIADFLSAIDRRIENIATQITGTQTFKKGLLQQMFV